jgi:hypothetical protein
MPVTSAFGTMAANAQNQGRPRMGPPDYRAGGAPRVGVPQNEQDQINKKKRPPVPGVPGQPSLQDLISKITGQYAQGAEPAPFQAPPTQEFGYDQAQNAAYGLLTKGAEEDYKRGVAEKEQELANRGIPVGSEAYTTEMGRLGEDYRTFQENQHIAAADRATQEQQRFQGAQNDIYNRAYTTYQAQQIPREQQLSSLTQLAGLIAQQQASDLARKNFRLQRQATKAQIAALKRPSGGSGGQQGPSGPPDPAADSPFYA